MGKVILWKPEEDQFIRDYYPEYGPQWCSERMDRSNSAIQKRARLLKVKSKKKKLKYHKDNLTKVVSESKTLREVLINLNLRTAGGNYQTVKKYIKEYGIDTSHFIEDEIRLEVLKKNRENVKIDINNILVENSTYNRTSLKKRLIEEGILEYRCVRCGNEGEWLGETLTLQIDHINGVHNDNRLENLRFLCPNCHTQTDNFAGRKNRKKDYSKLIESSKNRRKVERPPYDQLIEEINELGYCGTGRKYGVSDNSIRKWKKYYEKYENAR